ncbi:MAG TPA: hypothetical protein PLU58_13965 [Saprospiraceae bacterium]|mgnify:CR=1 FL=1|nr:hypothetical protein [Saprospiraceae bacterium]
MTRITIYLLVFTALGACKTNNRSKISSLSASKTLLKAQNDTSIKSLAANCEFVQKYVENNMKIYYNEYKNKNIELLSKNFILYQSNDTIIGLLSNSNCFKGFDPEEILRHMGKPSKGFNQFSGFIEYWFYQKNFDNSILAVRFIKPNDIVTDNLILVFNYEIDH